LITSTHNRRVSAAARLRKRGLREQDRRFLVEGAQAVGEALDAGVVETVFHVAGSGGRVPQVVEAARGGGAEVLEVASSVMAHLTSAVTPQGVVAVARFVDVPIAVVPNTGLVPVLCSVRDPGNAGTILRTADAAGASGVVVTRDSVDVYNPKAVRASAGSLFHLPVVRDVEPAEAVIALRDGGVRVVAASTDGEVPMDRADLTGPTALLLGNEAWGLPPEVLALADVSVRVPIFGHAESLNLAAAAAVLMFEAARQRAGGSGREGIGAVVSASVHDVRLPLTALKGFASTLVDRWEGFDDAVRKDMVQAMILDVERVSSMITLLVEAARIEQDRFRPARERREVADIVRPVADLFSRSADYPDVEATGTAEAAVERDRLQAILLALCDGALWWGQEGPIVIAIRPDGDGAAVEVRRTGTGPSPEELESMFGGPGAEGTKIGLYLARRVAEASGGGLTAEGRGGIRFHLRIPGAPGDPPGPGAGAGPGGTPA
jgi:TrmH family RNA methyltransferase